MWHTLRNGLGDFQAGLPNDGNVPKVARCSYKYMDTSSLDMVIFTIQSQIAYLFRFGKALSETQFM